MLIIDLEDIPVLANAKLTATCAGITATTVDGSKARLAVVDEHGTVLEAGDDVERAAWLLMLLARRNFLEGNGHIRVYRP